MTFRVWCLYSYLVHGFDWSIGDPFQSERGEAATAADQSHCQVSDDRQRNRSFWQVSAGTYVFWFSSCRLPNHDFSPDSCLILMFYVFSWFIMIFCWFLAVFWFFNCSLNSLCLLILCALNRLMPAHDFLCLQQAFAFSWFFISSLLFITSYLILLPFPGSSSLLFSS